MKRYTSMKVCSKAMDHTSTLNYTRSHNKLWSQFTNYFLKQSIQIWSQFQQVQSLREVTTGSHKHTNMIPVYKYDPISWIIVKQKPTNQLHEKANKSHNDEPNSRTEHFGDLFITNQPCEPIHNILIKSETFSISSHICVKQAKIYQINKPSRTSNKQEMVKSEKRNNQSTKPTVNP